MNEGKTLSELGIEIIRLIDYNHSMYKDEVTIWRE